MRLELIRAQRVLAVALAPVELRPPAQSTWDAASAAATLAAQFSLAIAVVAGLVLCAFAALLVHAALSGPKPVRRRNWLVAGLAVPAIMIVALTACSFAIGLAQPPPASPALTIEVNARQWWWEVRYKGMVEGKAVALANELHVPVGRPVLLRLSSGDVIHRFWVPPLGAKAPMVPGRVHHLQVVADRTGVFRGQCAELCGIQHAQMALHVVAEEEAAFKVWLAWQSAPAIPPADELLRAGRDAFLRAGCGGCHTVRGTEAQGEIGPDLTHVGSRRTLAAGTLVNVPGAIETWIAHSQRIKPGSLMPSASQLPAHQLGALAAYLESLQ
jgi:cytochrome c oxidase subunit 2